MKSKGFYKNKFFLGALVIIIIILGTDILLHKGMVRLMIPDSFVKNLIPADFLHCTQSLILHSKNWVKAIDSENSIKNLSQNTDGFEVDIYFDSIINSFYVYHDSSAMSATKIEHLLDIYKNRNLSASIWFDFKNLNSENHDKALNAFIGIRKKYNLENKMIIESPNIKYLPSYCESGFFTSYYTPFFNPYLLKEKDLKHITDSISNNLKQYPVSALSGYYFQYPFLKKYFPNYPILTWASKSDFSIVSFIFNHSLKEDKHLKIILYTQN